MVQAGKPTKVLLDKKVLQWPSMDMNIEWMAICVCNRIPWYDGGNWSRKPSRWLCLHSKIYSDTHPDLGYNRRACGPDHKG